MTTTLTGTHMTKARDLDNGWPVVDSDGICTGQVLTVGSAALESGDYLPVTWDALSEQLVRQADDQDADCWALRDDVPAADEDDECWAD